MVVSISGYNAIMASNTEGNISTNLLYPCLVTAQQLTEDNIGYTLDLGDSTFTKKYEGSKIISLGRYDVNSISEVKVNDITISGIYYSLTENCYLEISNKVTINYGDVIEATINSGYTEITLPLSIKLCICFIAQALSKNKGMGGYVQSSNLGDGNNITFDSTRYYRFYDLIKSYRMFSI